MSIFNTIKAQISIVDVVSEYATLKKAGSYFKGFCPFHQERTPSFTVTPQRDIFYCFSCKAGGDVVAFVAQIEKCSQREAALHLAEQYQLTLPEEFRQEQKAWDAQQRYVTLCEDLEFWYAEQLKRSPTALEYLEKRGIKRTSIEQFGIGYFPGGERVRKNLLLFLQKKGFLLDDLITNHYMVQHKQALYSPFEERIMFPIRDHLGRTCGFGGRIFTTGDSRPKYYNSHDHPRFNKGSLLFGLDLAKRSIQKHNAVYIVEGYTDCIALAQAGITNTVATLGTACTQEHLRLISKHASRLHIVYDRDPAGISAALRIGELCWDQELDLMITTLPLGQDPADFLLSGGNFAALQNEPIFDFYLSSLKNSWHNIPLSEKLMKIREIVTRIARVQDQLTRGLLLQQAAQACNIPLNTMTNELQKLNTPPPQRTPVAESPLSGQQKSLKEINIFAKKLFCAIIVHDARLSPEDKTMVVALLPEPLRSLFQKSQENRADPYIFSDFFITLSQEEQAYVHEIMLHYGTASAEEQNETVDELLMQCKKRYWKRMVQIIREKILIAQAQHDHEAVKKLMASFGRLKQSLQGKITL